MEDVKNLIRSLFPDKIAKILVLILSATLAWLLGKLLWEWFNQPVMTAPVHVVASSSSTNEEIDYELSTVLNHHLFGRYRANIPAQAKKKNLDNLPKIKMNLKLVGVVASTNEERSIAIIAYRNDQAIYGIDDLITGTRVKVRYILGDRVILDNNGNDETLMLEGVDFVSKAQDVFAQNSKTKTTQSNQAKSDISTIHEDILKNPQSLLKYITLGQERENGEIIGYRLGPGRDKRLFESSGLLQGDVAVEINNVDLTDPSQMNMIWRNLQDASEISLVVLREGQTHQINIGL